MFRWQGPQNQTTQQPVTRNFDKTYTSSCNHGEHESKSDFKENISTVNVETLKRCLKFTADNVTSHLHKQTQPTQNISPQ